MRTLRHRCTAWTAGAGALGAVVFFPAAAHALDTELTSDTAAQFYDVRSPTGETVLARRRVMTTIGVGAYNLIDRAVGDPNAPELLFRARLRYDADFGADAEETNTTNAGRLIPGYERDPVDLMYAYVEGRKFAHGWLGFKIGRQYTTDALGWWSFDGASVRVTTPFFVAVEALGGLEQRGGLPLSTPRYERDGIWRGDRTGFDPSMYPQFQVASLAPAYGFAVESAGVSWLHGRLSYRKVDNTGTSNVSDFASGLTTPVQYTGTRTSSERVGYAFEVTPAKIGALKGGIVYDLYNAAVGNMYASVDAFVSQRVTVSLDYDYYQPMFDADSIWNFFGAEPMNDLGARAVWDATDKLSFSGGGHARIMGQQTSPDSKTSSSNIDTVPTTQPNPNYFPTSGNVYVGGGNLAARYRWGNGVLGARGSGSFGDGGDRVGGDVYGERLYDARYVFTGRASLWQWKDELRPDRSATSFGYVAGVGYRFAQRSQALFEWEHNMNGLVGQRFRAMLVLSIAAEPVRTGKRGGGQ